MYNKRKVGRAIRTEMEASGYTNAEIAEALDLGKRVITNIKQGLPPEGGLVAKEGLEFDEVADRIADVLCLCLDEFLTDMSDELDFEDGVEYGETLCDALDYVEETFTMEGDDEEEEEEERVFRFQ